MRKIICTLLLLCFVFTNVSASITLTTDKYESGKYSVSGRVDSANIPVKIEILKNGVLEALTEADYADLDITYSDDSKTFSFEIPISVSGNYIVNIADFDGNKVTTDFTTYTITDMKTAIESFLNSYATKTPTDLKNLIIAYYGGLEIDYKDVLRLADKESTFYTNAYTALSGATYEKFAAIVKAELGATLVSKYGLPSDFAKYEKEMDLTSQTYYADYKLLSDANKLTAVSSAINAADIADMNSKIRESVILLALKSNEWSNYATIISKYAENGITGVTSILSIINNRNIISNKASSLIFGGLNNDINGKTNGVTITSTNDIPTRLTYWKEQYKNVPDDVVWEGGGGGVGSSPSKKDDTQSFTQPSVTPSVTGVPFKDLGSVSWASLQIIQLYEDGIVKGDENGNFNPQNTVTREEFVAMLVRALGFKASSTTSGFNDVPADRWSSSSVIAARENGIVNGISETMFGASNNIKRCDMTVMAFNALKKLGVEMPEDKESSFNDKKNIPDYALEAINVLSQAEIIKGNEGKFLPNDFTTRAEAAVIIHRVLALISK